MLRLNRGIILKNRYQLFHFFLSFFSFFAGGSTAPPMFINYICSSVSCANFIDGIIMAGDCFVDADGEEIRGGGGLKGRFALGPTNFIIGVYVK